MPLLNRSDLHEKQQLSIDHLYNHNSALALLPVGAGKTVIGWTAALELIEDGYVKRPIVFAPRMVAINEWPGQRFDWEHLKDAPMVDWSGEPSSWPESLWKTSRRLWGQRNHAEARHPNLAKTLTAKNDALIANKQPHLTKEQLRERIQHDQELSEQFIAGLKAEEKAINKKIRETEHPEMLHCTSYENLEWFCELYPVGKGPFDLWIFDEIGKLKNPTSPRYKMIAKRTQKALEDGAIIWGLNATPAPEGLEDLFTQVKIVDGGKLWGDSFYDWRKEYFVAIDWEGHTYRPQLGARKILLEQLSTVAFRVDETDLSYLKTMQHSPTKVDFPAKARKAYDEMLKKMQVELAGLKPGATAEDTIVAMTKAAASTKLRQITQGFIYDEDGQATVIHTAKADALSDLIDAMSGEPMLIAYDFKEDLEAIRRVWKNIPYIGSGTSATKVKQHITDWNDRKLKVLAIHPQSAGHGLNLQKGGSHICWYALPWALELYLQTNGRVDRQGQTRACFGHHLVVRNSMDEKVSEALRAKDVEQRLIIDAIRRL